MATTAGQGSGSRRLAWGLAALIIALQLACYALAAVWDAAERTGFSFFVVSVLATAFVLVGALVASREPRNPLGWLFLGVAFAIDVAGFTRAFVEHRLGQGDTESTLVGVAAAYSDASWVPFILIPSTLLLLLFPDGRLPSPRWRIVARCSVLGIVGVFLTTTTVEQFEDFPTVSNPLAVDTTVLDPLTALSFLLMLFGLIGSVSSVFVRYRRAGALQRRQIKWLATAGAVVAVTLPGLIVSHEVIGRQLADGGIMLTILGLPVAMGVAILRHDLYDIDVVINRTLVYGALTGLLAATYLGSVLLLQLVLSPSSDLAIAGSTLAVAALVRPARARIQATVDRRFFRSRYDAQLTLAAFGGRLRDEVSLDALSVELREVVGETMRPAHVSLWMRGRP